MIRDNDLIFSDSQAITATAFSTKSIEVTNGNLNDKQVAFLDIAPGESIRVVGRITESFNTLTSLLFELFVNNADSFSGAETLVLQRLITLASGGLALGKTLFDGVLPNEILPDPPRQRIFYKARYTVGGTDPTTGKIDLAFSWGSHSANHDAT